MAGAGASDRDSSTSLPLFSALKQPASGAEIVLGLGWIATTSLALLLGILLIRKWNSERKQLRLPPGPRGVPVFGSLFSVFKSSSKLPHQALSDLSKKYGPLMSLRLGSRLCIVVSSPELAKEVLREQDRNFATRPHTTAMDHLVPPGSVAFSPYNAYLKNMRKISTVELLSHIRVQQLEWVRKEELAMSVRSILADSRQHGGRLSPVNVDMKMKLLNLNSITRSLFSKRFYDYGDEGDSFTHDHQEAVEFKELTDDMFRLVAVPILGDYVPYLSFLDRLSNYKQQMQQTQKRVDAFLSRVLENHRERLRSAAGAVPQERDLLDVLLSLAGHALGDFQLDDDRIKGAITSFTLAGTSSAASVVEWALAELLRAPQLLHKAQQELDSVVGRERLVAEADIPSLPFLQAVIKETFRLHPPLTLLLPHESIEDCQVRGYHVPAKTTLFVNVWEIGRNPEVWENPLKFRPERFEASEIEPKGKHFELLPFGTGRRGCPALNLGLLSAQHALARLLQAFDWSLPDGQTAENLDMAEGSGLSTPRAQPLWALPHPRLPANMY